jgi:hypothetical protein
MRFLVDEIRSGIDDSGLWALALVESRALITFLCRNAFGVCCGNKSPVAPTLLFRWLSVRTPGVRRPRRLPHTRPLSDEANSRETIYGDRF